MELVGVVVPKKPGWTGWNFEGLEILQYVAWLTKLAWGRGDSLVR
jgi:hypothetical protein